MLIFLIILAGIAITVLMVVVPAYCLIDRTDEEFFEGVMYTRLPTQWLLDAAQTAILLSQAERVLDRC